MSPRIGILGVSTFPSEADFLNPDGSNFISGSLNKDNFGFGSSQQINLPGKIDDVSNSVNKQIKLLEVSNKICVYIVYRTNWLKATICFNYLKKMPI